MLKFVIFLNYTSCGRGNFKKLKLQKFPKLKIKLQEICEGYINWENIK